MAKKFLSKAVQNRVINWVRVRHFSKMMQANRWLYNRSNQKIKKLRYNPEDKFPDVKGCKIRRETIT